MRANRCFQAVLFDFYRTLFRFDDSISGYASRPTAC